MFGFRFYSMFPETKERKLFSPRSFVDHQKDPVLIWRSQRQNKFPESELDKDLFFPQTSILDWFFLNQQWSWQHAKIRPQILLLLLCTGGNELQMVISQVSVKCQAILKRSFESLQKEYNENAIPISHAFPWAVLSDWTRLCRAEFRQRMRRRSKQRLKVNKPGVEMKGGRYLGVNFQRASCKCSCNCFFRGIVSGPCVLTDVFSQTDTWFEGPLWFRSVSIKHFAH